MRQGFSLIELSVILIIIGMITGGILSGQHLIRNAELKRVLNEFGQYSEAATLFRERYRSLPGDMHDATSLWGSFSLGGGCPSGSGVGTETCNGNGDGVLFGNGADQAIERYLFWQHLANAGFIDEEYTGKSGTGGGLHSMPGVNVPVSSIGEGLWFADQANNIGGAASMSGIYFFELDYKNFFLIGELDGDCCRPRRPVASTNETWSIDNKLDDGLATSGAMIAVGVQNCTTAADQTDLTGEYDLGNNDSKACAILLRDQF